MLTRKELEEIVAFDNEKRDRTLTGKLYRTTCRYTYLRHDGGVQGARNFRERPGVVILHVAVRLDRAYVPVVKVLAVMDIAKRRVQFSDIDCSPFNLVATVVWDRADYGVHRSPCEAKPLEPAWHTRALKRDDALGDRVVVNPEALQGTRFEYAGYRRGCGHAILKYLTMAEDWPEVEYLAKADMYWAMSPAILSALRRDRALLAKLKERKGELAKAQFEPGLILHALRHDCSVAAAREHFDFAGAWSKIGSLLMAMPLGELHLDYERLRRAVKKWRVNASEYFRYLGSARHAGLDLKSDGVKYPPTKGGREAFMARLERIEADVARLNALARRKEAARLRALDKQMAPEFELLSNAIKLDWRIPEGLSVRVPTSQRELRRYGAEMRNCVGNGDYWRRMVAGKCVILEMLEGGKAAYCVEIECKRWHVVQCYGRANGEAPDAIKALAGDLALAMKAATKKDSKRRLAA
ncbi:MAG: PcfJ domain-containing protein [Kiritimatiellae bacterium]|nr:PcfJ domain-containing protein [Kiritimatiellia bacterium]